MLVTAATKIFCTCVRKPVLEMQGKTRFKLKREMSAGALEGRVMKMLCAISGAKTVLEVGMFTGTSALAMAEIIPDDGKVNFWV